MKAKKTEWPESVVKVMLPDSAGYASCPSGDTDYTVDYDKAMKAAVPDGFEAIKTRLGHNYPVDSEGYTWVLLKCTDSKNVMKKLKDENKKLRSGVKKAREALEVL